MSVSEYRKRTGYSQQQVADLTGIRQGYYSRIERGRASNVGFDKLQRLAEIYDVELGEFAEAVAATVRSASEHTLEYVSRLMCVLLPSLPERSAA